MSDDDYEPIGDETLFGVPVDELPDLDPERNFFDENQAIVEDQIAENDEGLLNDYY